MAGLCSSMYNCVRFNFVNKFYNRLPVPDIYFIVKKIWKPVNQPLLIPPGVALRTKEVGPHIIIYSINTPALVGEKSYHFTADKAAGTRYNYSRHNLVFYFLVSKKACLN